MRSKLNALLARAEHSAKQYQQLLMDYIDTFAKKQGIFRGKRQDYVAAPEQEDMPQYRGNEPVQSTVKDYLKWMEDTTAEYIDHRFSIEATNATGPQAELQVGGQSWGSFTTLELMRLGDLLNDPKLNKLYETLPVRSDTKVWSLSSNKELAEQGIVETDAREQQNKTTIKSSRILSDPNLPLLKGNQNYIPQVVPDDKSLLLGTITIQEFSGEMTHIERAKILRRLTELKAAVKEALTIANESPAVDSTLTAKMIFRFLHIGTI